MKNIFSKSEEVISGWKNWMFKKSTIEELAEERTKICRTNLCGFYVKEPYRGCSECGCPERQKTRSLKSRCPEKLWDYAHTLPLKLSETLMDDLSGMKKRCNLGKIIYSRRDVKIEFDPLTNTAKFPIFEDEKPVSFWNELWDLYKQKTGKKLY